LAFSAALCACGLSGCLFARGSRPPDDPGAGAAHADDAPDNGPSAYHAHVSPPPRDRPPGEEALTPAHFPAAPPEAAPTVKLEAPPAPPPPLSPAPAAPGPADLPSGAPAPPEPPAVVVLRCLLDRRPLDAKLLEGYDRVSQEVLAAVLPLAALASEGGLERASPQETAALLDQLHQLENALRPRAALTLDKTCFCREIKGFGKYDPWPEGHVFQSGTDGCPGERMRVYLEVRNFTSRPSAGGYETALTTRLKIYDFRYPDKPISLLEPPLARDRSQTFRQDYFINVQFHLPPRLPAGRYTLRIEVCDALASDGAPRAATRSLDFTVAGGARD
jgi:hypothetical protein